MPGRMSLRPHGRQRKCSGNISSLSAVWLVLTLQPTLVVG